MDLIFFEDYRRRDPSLYPEILTKIKIAKLLTGKKIIAGKIYFENLFSLYVFVNEWLLVTRIGSDPRL